MSWAKNKIEEKNMFYNFYVKIKIKSRNGVYSFTKNAILLPQSSINISE